MFENLGFYKHRVAQRITTQSFRLDGMEKAFSLTIGTFILFRNPKKDISNCILIYATC